MREDNKKVRQDDNTTQHKTRQRETGQDKMREDNTQGQTRQGQGKTREHKNNKRQHKTAQDEHKANTRQDKTR